MRALLDRLGEWVARWRGVPPAPTGPEDLRQCLKRLGVAVYTESPSITVLPCQCGGGVVVLHHGATGVHYHLTRREALTLACDLVDNGYRRH